MSVPVDHLIGGEWVSSSATFASESPLDGRHLADVARGGGEEIDAAVEAAAAGFRIWAALSPEERAEKLGALEDRMVARAAELGAVETADMGWNERFGPGPAVRPGALRARARAAVERRPLEWERDGTRFCVHKDPSGVVGVILPWNAPLLLGLARAAPALAVGCSVVLKPAEWAPLSLGLLGEITVEAGLPPGVVNVVQGIGEEAGAALAAHPGLSRVSFTGSVETGKLVAQAAAANLVPVYLELGGKGAIGVFDDADLEAAARTAAAQYANAGQACVAGTRLLVQESVRDELLERLTAAAGELRLGDSREADTQVGPLIHEDHLARVDGFVQRAIAEGARPAYGGRVAPALGGLYYEPTLLVDVRQDMEIVQNEVFGPVLTLQTFTDEEEFVELANGSRYGLGDSVFTGDEQRARRLATRLEGGSLWVNCHFARDPASPHGGTKDSGIGRTGGEYDFDTYGSIKNLAIKGSD